MLWNNEYTREGRVGEQKIPNTVLYRSYLQQSAASAAQYVQKVPLEQMASLMDYFSGQDYTSIPITNM
jgi:hypothetical protein